MKLKKGKHTQWLHSFKIIPLSMIMLMLILPVSTFALQYVYTYTGEPYNWGRWQWEWGSGKPFYDPPPEYWGWSGYQTKAKLITDGPVKVGTYDNNGVFWSDQRFFIAGRPNSEYYPAGNWVEKYWINIGSVDPTSLLPTSWGMSYVDEFFGSDTYSVGDGFSEYESYPLFHWQMGSGGGGTWTLVPEPATMILLGSGLIGLAGYGRKKFFKK